MSKFTIRPRSTTQLFQPGMLSGAPKLPKQTGTLTGHGIHQVEFPLFDNDPGMFLPEHMQSCTVVELKEQYKRETMCWTIPGEEPINLPTLEALNAMPLRARAEAIVSVLNEYHKRPIMPTVVHNLILNTSKHTTDNMTPDNFRMALVGYIGHYAGEGIDHLFNRAVTAETYMGNLKPDLIAGILRGASEVVRSQKEAVGQILQSQHDRGLTPVEKIAELGEAMVRVGLDSPEAHTAAHFPTFADTQFRPQAPQQEQPRAALRR